MVVKVNAARLTKFKVTSIFTKNLNVEEKRRKRMEIAFKSEPGAFPLQGQSTYFGF
jgi:hypothetical protein